MKNDNPNQIQNQNHYDIDNDILNDNDYTEKLIDNSTPHDEKDLTALKRNIAEYVDNDDVKIVFKEKKNNIFASILILTQTLIVSLFFLYQRYVYSSYPNLSYGKTNLFVGIYLSLFTYYSAKKENLDFSYDKKTNIFLFFRVMTSVSSESMMFLASKYARLSTISCFMIMYTVVSCILIGLILSQKTTLKDYSFLLACCIGSVLIIKPFSGDGEDSLLGLSLGFSSMFIFSTSILINSIIMKSTHHYIMNFYVGLSFMILGVIICYFEGSFHLKLFEIIILSIAGCFYTSIRYLFNYALVMGDLQYILPFDNFSTVFCSIFGHYFLGDNFDSFDFIGISIVLSVCVYKSIE